MTAFPVANNQNNNIMKAYEKFENRLRELGLYEEWCKQGSCGRIGVETAENIIILIHEGDDDAYTECTFPTMRELSKSDEFRIRALKEFLYCDDEDFRKQLCLWVADERNKCPLFPVDVYFCYDGYTFVDFEDDEEEPEEWYRDNEQQLKQNNMRNFEVKAIVTMVFPNVRAKAEDAAIAMIAEQIPATISSKAGVAGITIDDFEVTCYDFMDASNNHDADLVEKINLAWHSKRHEFIDIVRLLVKRDIWDDNPEFFEQSVEDQCRVYCQHIADDKDLRIILDYCRA